MQELADAVSAVVAPAANVQSAAFSPHSADRYVGDGHMYRSLVARYSAPEHDLKRQIADTADYLIND